MHNIYRIDLSSYSTEEYDELFNSINRIAFDYYVCAGKKQVNDFVIPKSVFASASELSVEFNIPAELITTPFQ